MNENRMETSINIGELSPLPAQAPPYGWKMGRDEVLVSQTLHFVAAIWLAIPSGGCSIAKMTGEITFAP